MSKESQKEFSKEVLKGFRNMGFLLFFILLVMFIFISASISGYTPIGIGLLGIVVASALISTISKKVWLEFLILYIKSSFYCFIAVFTFAKMTQLGGQDNLELILIASVSVVESVHNLILWVKLVRTL